jgi:hypothetical protein
MDISSHATEKQNTIIYMCNYELLCTELVLGIMVLPERGSTLAINDQYIMSAIRTS